jgi:Ala-tRNA(Pro) deacylase
MRESRTPDGVRERCESIFKAAALEFLPHQHQPVLDYDAATAVREKFNLTGAETKSLFLKCKSGRWVMFVSLEGERIDRKRAQEAVGEKFSIATGEELKSETGCLPGCAVPLGLPAHVSLLLDPALKSASNLIFSSGLPTETLQVSADEWMSLVAAAKNEMLKY